MRTAAGTAACRIQLAVQPPEGLDFESVVRMARTAEAAHVDLLLLPEGRPDALTTLAALSGVTDRLGLAATVDPAAAQPFEIARQLATLDHLTGGRAGWRLSDPCAEFVSVVGAFWDSWAGDAVVADRASGTYVNPAGIGEVRHRGARFDLRGVATLPAGPQGHPPLIAVTDVPVRDAYAEASFRPLHTADMVGDPRTVADDVVAWAGACDGVHLLPESPAALDEFLSDVVLSLRERGSVVSRYARCTLRGHLGG